MRTQAAHLLFRRALLDFLTDAFTDVELRQLVIFTAGRQSAYSLPSPPVSRAALAEGVLQVYERSHFDETLFQYFDQEIPKRKNDIDHLRALWQKIQTSKSEREQHKNPPITPNVDVSFAGLELRLPFIELLENPTLLVGETLGDYSIKEFVGVGGTGIVYRTATPDQPYNVCLKLCHPLRPSQDTVLRLLTRAMRGLSSINNPLLSKYIDFGQLTYKDSTSFYIVTNYVEGLVLDRWVWTNRPSLEQKLLTAAQITQGLAVAHEHHYFDEFGIEQVGILHGDVTPKNILVGTDGIPRIIDFMLVDLHRLQDPRTRAQLHSELMMTAQFGTPGFMHPLQEHYGVMTIKTDIFTLVLSLGYLFGHYHLAGWQVHPEYESILNPFVRLHKKLHHSALESVKLDARSVLLVLEQCHDRIRSPARSSLYKSGQNIE